MEQAETATRNVVVPAIAGVMGSVIHIGAGVLTPFVALALIATAKVGMHTWCNSERDKEPSFTDPKGDPTFIDDQF